MREEEFKLSLEGKLNSGQNISQAHNFFHKNYFRVACSFVFAISIRQFLYGNKFLNVLGLYVLP